MLRRSKQDLYTIPELPLKEIIDYFGDLQISIKSQDILNPTTAAILKLFDLLMELYTEETSSNLIIKYRNEFDITELEDSAQITVIYKKVLTFLINIGINNFTIRTLCFPERKRMLAVLSAIVNFSMYRDNKSHLYKEAAELINNADLTMKDILVKTNELEKKLSSLEEESLLGLKTKKNLEIEVSNLLNEEKSLDSQSLECKFNKLMVELEKTSEDLNSYNFENESLSEEITAIKVFLGANIEEMRNNLKVNESNINSDKEAFNLLSKNKNDLAVKIDQLIPIQSTISELKKIKDQIYNLDVQIEKTSNEINAINKEIKDNTTAIQSLNIKIDHETRKIYSVESRFNALLENHRIYSLEAQKMLEDLNKEYEDMTHKSNMYNSKIQDITESTRNMEFEQFRMKSAHEKEICEIIGIISEFKSTILNLIRQCRSVDKN